MGGSTTLIVILGAILVTLLGLWAYRRSATPKARRNDKRKAADPSESGEGKASEQREQWGVRIDAQKKRACPQVLGLLGTDFPLSEKPPLPLADCPFPQQCECRYVKLRDRRTEERRASSDRREGERFEKDHTPRRKGKDRRKNKVDWT